MRTKRIADVVGLRTPADSLTIQIKETPGDHLDAGWIFFPLLPLTLFTQSLNHTPSPFRVIHSHFLFQTYRKATPKIGQMPRERTSNDKRGRKIRDSGQRKRSMDQKTRHRQVEKLA